MAARLLLIRHGETTLAAEDRYAGAGTDAPLSAHGRSQVERLGARLAGEKLAAVYCSPLGRARDTARAVARPHGLEPIERAGLREIHHGRWEGLTRAEIQVRHAGESDAWVADPFAVAPVGGETGAEVLARALPALREIARAHEGSRVAVVSHKGTLRLLACALLGIEPRGYRERLEQSAAGLDVVEWDGEAPARLVTWNDVAHVTGLGGKP
jgi:probable phosphoglycerate mutase